MTTQLNDVSISNATDIAAATLETSGLATTNTLAITVSGTTPAPSSSDNSTTLINSAWAKLGFAVSLAATGYVKLPAWLGGLVFQWGAANAASSSQVVSFPYTGWSSVWAVVCQPVNFGPNAGRANPYLDAVSTSSFTQTSAGSTNSIYWFAVGH